MSFADQLLSYRALERLLSALHRVRQGDFSARMAAEGDGVDRDVADAINELITMLASLTKEFDQIAKNVAKGDLQSKVVIDKTAGGWAIQIRAVNDVVQRFFGHVTEMRRAVKAVHSGDLARTVDLSPEGLHHSGELLLAAEEVNAMMGHLRVVASKLTDAITHLNIDGRFNRQCHVSDLGGAWIVLVGALNAMTVSLGEQIQDLCATAGAYATGNLAARASSNGRGDLQELRASLNSAGENMAALCEELRRVTQLVVSEGKLTVDLSHPNPRGDIQTAQESCNRALALIAKTVRGINQGVSGLLDGDYASEIPAIAPGELGASLEHIQRLAQQEKRTQRTLENLLAGKFGESIQDGSERDNALFLLGIRLKHEWLSAVRVGVLQAYEKHSGGPELAKAVLARVAGAANAAAGAYYLIEQGSSLVQVANLGSGGEGNAPASIALGEGLVGKAALEGKPLILDKLDSQATRLRSGLIEIVPRSLVIFPLMDGERVISVFELIFTTEYSKVTLELLEYLSADLIEGSQRTPRKASTESAEEGERIRQLQEELLIATTRIEHLRIDLQQRDRNLRELQAEAASLRERVAQQASDSVAETNLF